MKALDYLFVAMLAVTAVLQFNDPDPAYWVTVYGLGAAVPLMHALGRQARFLAALTIGMIISGMLYAAPGFFDYLVSGRWGSITGSMDGPDAYVEPAREFIGLLIALAIVSFYALRWRANQNR
ncbi:MAG: transmembrane 220 family protein [Gammaproteobacteria bacterium]